MPLHGGLRNFSGPTVGISSSVPRHFHPQAIISFVVFAIGFRTAQVIIIADAQRPQSSSSHCNRPYQVIIFLFVVFQKLPYFGKEFRNSNYWRYPQLKQLLRLLVYSVGYSDRSIGQVRILTIYIIAIAIFNIAVVCIRKNRYYHFPFDLNDINDRS